MAKTKRDNELYDRLRNSGLRKRVAKLAAEAVPAKGQTKPRRAHRVADQLTYAAETIRERAGGGSRKRSQAAKKAAQTRKQKAMKRSAAGKKGARTRARS